ncbi:MAG: DNA replication and repair protein RecF [Myxococcota bacterium]
MRLERLTVSHVRSITSATVELAPQFTLITGPNGAGKTNLLEAAHLAATLRPLTTGTPGEVVQNGQTRAEVAAILTGGVLPLEVRVIIENGRRRATVAGKPLRDHAAYLGTLATMAFTPDDLRLVKEGPEARRNFLNRAASQLWPAAREELRRLERALKQRSAALRGGARLAVLEALNEPLAASVVAVWRRRERTLSALEPHATRWLAHLLDGRALQLGLRPGMELAPERFAALSDEERAAALVEELARTLDEDRRRGSTSVGPHHDDLELFLDGQAARRFASQGQQRCVALALTLGVVDALREARAAPPLVLLDDVSSELDDARRGALFQALADAGSQVMATATDESLLPLPPGYAGEVARYRASAGTFTPTK